MYFNQRNDCDSCKHQYMTGWDEIVDACRRQDEGLPCEYEEEKEAFCVRWGCFVDDMPEWRRASCGVGSCSHGSQGENECPFLRWYRRGDFEND